MFDYLGFFLQKFSVYPASFFTSLEQSSELSERLYPWIKSSVSPLNKTHISNLGCAFFLSQQRTYMYWLYLASTKLSEE